MTWQLDVCWLDRRGCSALSLYYSFMAVAVPPFACQGHISLLSTTTIFQRLFEYSFSAAKLCFLAARKASLHKLCSICLKMELYLAIDLGAVEREKGWVG